MELLSHLILNKNELRLAVIHLLASAPSSPVEGQLYYNTTDHGPYVRDNGAWVPLDARMRTGIPITNLATDPLARANHTGTQTASTISDFNTAVRLNRLDQMAAPTAAVSMNSQNITNLATPSASTDAATKQYVDDVAAAAAAGIDAKASCRAATTANITLSGAQTIDGVSVVAGDRVLVKNQSTGSQNGIYVASNSSWSRSTDCDTSAEYTSAAFTFIEEGTTNGGTQWKVSTTGAINVGVTSVTWAQFGAGSTYTGSDTITLTGNAFSVHRKTGGRLSEDAGGLYVDSTIPTKYATDVGDGSSTIIAITHSLGSRDVKVEVYRNTTPWDTVYCDVERNSTSQVTLKFSVAPTSNQYRVVVTG